MKTSRWSSLNLSPAQVDALIQIEAALKDLTASQSEGSSDPLVKMQLERVLSEIVILMQIGARTEPMLKSRSYDEVRATPVRKYSIMRELKDIDRVRPVPKGGLRNRAVEILSSIRFTVRARDLINLERSQPVVPMIEIYRFGSFQLDDFISYITLQKRGHNKILMKRAASGEETPWILPAIDSETQMASRSHFTLSSWDLSERILTPISTQVNEYKLFFKVAEALDANRKRRDMGRDRLFENYVADVLPRTERPDFFIEKQYTNANYLARFKDIESQEHRYRSKAARHLEQAAEAIRFWGKHFEDTFAAAYRRINRGRF